MLPLLPKFPKLYIYGCDFSQHAIELLQQKPEYDPNRARVFQCDITKQDLTDNIEPESVDIISCIFVLSAIYPEDLQRAVENLLKVLRKGGILIFRDYAIDDTAQHRFKPDRKIDETLFVRQDGTFSHYFSTDEIATLFTGLELLENDYVFRKTTNIKEGVDADRKFIQSRFKKV